MDPLSDVLSLLAIRGYASGGFALGSERSLRFEPHHGIKCYAVTSGSVWLALDGPLQPVRLEAGDCFILPHGQSFRIATDLTAPSTDFATFIARAGTDRSISLRGGVGPRILGSFFGFDGPGADVLLAILPSIVHLRAERDREILRTNFMRMQDELIGNRPGCSIIVLHLAMTTLVLALRLHLDTGAGVGWLFALADRQISSALVAMHADPSHRWTVESLAAKAGMSRSSFAARFRQKVGDGPIEYLTRWRMLLAGRDLAQGKQISVISRSFGYSSESAFSTAFKRVMGHPPRRKGEAAISDIL